MYNGNSHSLQMCESVFSRVLSQVFTVDFSSKLKVDYKLAKLSLKNSLNLTHYTVSGLEL